MRRNRAVNSSLPPERRRGGYQALGRCVGIEADDIDQSTMAARSRFSSQATPRKTGICGTSLPFLWASLASMQERLSWN
jgi:hypothetical protein